MSNLDSSQNDGGFAPMSLENHIYKCSTCDFSTKRKNNLRQHIRRNHLTNNPFKCSKCPYTTGCRNTFSRHVKQKHESRKTLECFMCDYVTYDRYSMRLHSHVHAPRNPFTCFVCNYSAVRKQSIVKHLQENHSLNSPYNCTQCDFSTPDIRIMSRHFLNSHSSLVKSDITIDGEEITSNCNRLRFKCPKPGCEYFAVRKSSLANHITKNHYTQKIFSCSECEKSGEDEFGACSHNISKIRAERKVERHVFNCPSDNCDYIAYTLSAYRGHISRKHPHEKLYKCSECDFRGQRPRDVVRHERFSTTCRPSKTKAFRCSECDYVASEKFFLRNHIKRMHTHENPFVCSLCDYTAFEKSYVEAHVNVVHKLKKPYKCSHCDFSTAWKKYLDVHIESQHGSEKKFKCPCCDLLFASKEEVNVHIRAEHSDKRPFACSKCSHNFGYSCDLKRHFDLKHSKNILERYECPHCSYSATVKRYLKRHIERKHCWVLCISYTPHYLQTALPSVCGENAFPPLLFTLYFT